MYESFFGLKEAPFNLTPDPDFLFLNKRSKDALNHILYGIERREGFALIVGDVGTGKTTLCWALLERLAAKKNIRTALIQNPMLSEKDILRAILQDLGVRPEPAPAGDTGADEKPVAAIFDSSWTSGMTRKELIDRLNNYLVERAREDAFTVLIIDESQNLSLDLLEQLRLLSNIETAKKKLLQIIFVGQLELDHKLKLPSLRQLNQRISIRFETKTLSREETERYIRHRLIVAGGARRLRWGRGVFKAIHRHSKGYPRLINLICDRTLLAALSERSYLVTKNMVRKAVLSLEGKEDVRLGRIPAWCRKLLPVFGAIVLLLLLLGVLALKGAFKLKRAATAPGPVQGVAKPMSVEDVSSLPKAAPATVEPAPAAVAATRSETMERAEKTAPPAESPVPAVPPLPAHSQGTPEFVFVLQVHSFARKDQADWALELLNRSDSLGFIRYQINTQGSAWYVVFAGPFSDLDSARQKAVSLRKSDNLSPIIRRLNIK